MAERKMTEQGERQFLRAKDDLTRQKGSGWGKDNSPGRKEVAGGRMTHLGERKCLGEG